MLFLNHWIYHQILYWIEMYIYWMWFIFTKYWKWHYIYLFIGILLFLTVIKILRSVKVVEIDAKLHEALLRLASKK